MHSMLLLGAPLIHAMPQARHTQSGDFFRKVSRLTEGLALNAKDRYWRWAGFETIDEVEKLFIHPGNDRSAETEVYRIRRENLLKHIGTTKSMHDVLYTDMQLVLVNDMLVKVDMMSMANSLEVRVPFLDYTVVNYVFSLPFDSKIKNGHRKRILKDTFKNILPEEIYHRKKQGFEVPLLNWFRNELNGLIMDDLLSEKFIREQGIFNYTQIAQLKNKMMSMNPGDVHAKIWALLVFQYWWKKWIA